MSNTDTWRDVFIVCIFYILGAWIVNINKFSQCDFESPYKCEMVHAIGLVPIAATITAWFSFEEGK